MDKNMFLTIRVSFHFISYYKRPVDENIKNINKYFK